jgi:hypothetical protein
MDTLVAATWKTLPELSQALGVDLPGGVRALQQAGLITAAATPAAPAKKHEVARWMTRRNAPAQFLWHEERVRQALAGKHVVPAPLGIAVGTPHPCSAWGSMARVGHPLNLDARKTGERLKRLGLRDGLGHPTQAAIALHLPSAHLLENGRLAYVWHLRRTQLVLGAETFTGHDAVLQHSFALAQAFRRAATALRDVQSPTALAHQLGLTFVDAQAATMMALPLLERAFTVQALLNWLNAPTDRPGRMALESRLAAGTLWGVKARDLQAIRMAQFSS